MKFTIGFEPEDRQRLHEYWDRIIETGKWSEGYFTQLFEERWSEVVSLDSVAFSSWAGGALAALEFFKVRGKVVLCPSNTFMATPLSVIKAGGRVEFVDCNRADLCMSLEDLKLKVDLFKPAAVWLVHIGGHIAFETPAITDYCREKGIVLLEDCAHAHGASWNGKSAGQWGQAGVYSFYATKTISTGEGGMLCTRNQDLMEFAQKYRNYGKLDYKVEGLNYRMSEFTAAIGCVQADRLRDIVLWKNEFAQKHLDPQYEYRVKFPRGMISGYYKYIVFSKIEKSTGKVYDEPCHKIIARPYELRNTEWVSQNHWCVPLYYKGESL